MTDGVGPLLAKAYIVFGVPTFVGMTFDDEYLLGKLPHPLSLLLQQALCIGRQRVAIGFEIDGIADILQT